MYFQLQRGEINASFLANAVLVDGGLHFTIPWPHTMQSFTFLRPWKPIKYSLFVSSAWRSGLLSIYLEHDLIALLLTVLITFPEAKIYHPIYFVPVLTLLSSGYMKIYVTVSRS